MLRLWIGRRDGHYREDRSAAKLQLPFERARFPAKPVCIVLIAPGEKSRRMIEYWILAGVPTFFSS